jgi:hypothetical protein
MLSEHVLPPKSEAAPPRERNSSETPPTRPVSGRWSLLRQGLFLLGLMSLSYVLGAAVLFFELPSSEFLTKAFLGARAWNEERQRTAQSPDPGLSSQSKGHIDKPGKTFDGFTLITCGDMPGPGTEAFLIDMSGKRVHTWSIAFSKVWSRPPHLPVWPPVDDDNVHWFDCHPYPNGDLLVVFHGRQHPANGYGLAKLDKDSNVIWKYAGPTHHDVDVGEDGTIYAIQHEMASEMPPGLEFIPAPCLVDSLVMLSPEGKELRKPIPILEAFRNSPYATLLWSLQPAEKAHALPGGLTVSSSEEFFRRRDSLHTNSVKVLSRQRAPIFPAFQAGQLLISMRNLDTIAVIDPHTDAVVWAARGPWRCQHDASFLDNGHLLIFDNDGIPGRSRVLEYDPQIQAFPWSYAGEKGTPFYTIERGMSQRLPNGNTLIVNSAGREIREVTAEKEVVWTDSADRFITSARRYAPQQLPFLKGGHRARPQ